MNKTKTILVAGGCGYVGSRLALLLDKQGYKTIVADKASPQERGISFPSSIEFRLGDLRETQKAAEAVRGADTIVHLAANIGSMNYMHEHPAEIIQENSAIDAALYPATVDAGVKKIIYSSSSMVFQHPPCFPYKESDLAKINPPTNVYGLSKLAGEYFCRAFFEQFGLRFVILRYHNIYGPGEDAKGETPGDIHVLPALCVKVLAGQYPLEILGGLDATRPFTFVDDAVRATFQVVEKAMADDPQVVNNDFNIGPGEATNILDLAKLIWETLGDGRPFAYIVKETKADTALRREMDPEKIEKIIGWKPEMSLKEGILKTAEWLKTRDKKPLSVLN